MTGVIEVKSDVANHKIEVDYEPSKVTTDQMLASLKTWADPEKRKFHLIA